MSEFSLQKEKLQHLAQLTAKKYGLNEDLFLKQIRQESGFNPKARSGAGAIGLGQIMPATAKGYGVKPEALLDPSVNLDLAAKIMQKNLKTYNNDYVLALAAYNGGGGAVDFVQKQFGRPITGHEWVQFNSERQQKKGRNPNAWHTQTLDYVNKITGQSQPTKLGQAKPTQQPSSPPQENGQVPPQEFQQPKFALDPEVVKALGAHFGQRPTTPEAPIQSQPQVNSQLEELRLALQQREIQAREMEMQAMQHQQMLNEQAQVQKMKDQRMNAANSLANMGSLVEPSAPINLSYEPVQTYTPQLEMQQQNPWQGFNSQRGL